MRTVDLSGIWVCSVPGQTGSVRLPGTLDEAGIGSPDDPLKQWQAEDVKRLGFWREGDPIVTRLTRRNVFEGQVRFSRNLLSSAPAAAQSAVSSIIRNTVMPVLLIPFFSRWFSFSGPRPADPSVFC